MGGGAFSDSCALSWLSGSCTDVPARPPPPPLIGQPVYRLLLQEMS